MEIDVRRIGKRRLGAQSNHRGAAFQAGPVKDSNSLASSTDGTKEWHSASFVLPSPWYLDKACLLSGDARISQASLSDISSSLGFAFPFGTLRSIEMREWERNNTVPLHLRIMSS